MGPKSFYLKPDVNPLQLHLHDPCCDDTHSNRGGYPPWLRWIVRIRWEWVRLDLRSHFSVTRNATPDRNFRSCGRHGNTDQTKEAVTSQRWKCKSNCSCKEVCHSFSPMVSFDPDHASALLPENDFSRSGVPVHLSLVVYTFTAHGDWLSLHVIFAQGCAEDARLHKPGTPHPPPTPTTFWQSGSE